MTKLPIVEVEWVDSCTGHGWNSPEQHLENRKEGTRCRTAGYLLERNAKRVMIAQSVGDDTGDVADSVSIPAVSVKRLRRLK